MLLLRLMGYTNLRKTVAGRVRRYNASVGLIRRPPRGVAIVEICPPDDFRPTRLGRDKDALILGYQQGRDKAPEAMRLWQAHCR